MAIRKRGASWVLDVRVGGDRVRRHYSTWKDANAALGQLDRAAVQGPGYVSLKEVLLRYVSLLRTRGKASSARQALIHVGLILRHLDPALDARAFNAGDVERFIQARQEEGVRSTTINGNLRVLRAALRHAVELELLSSPPKVRLLRELRRLPTRLCADEVDTLVAAAKPPADLAILLAAHAGLRHREITHLAVDDVDLEAGVVRVTGKKIWGPKTHAEREVPLTRRLAEALAKQVEGRDPTEWLFPGRSSDLPLKDIGERVREAFQETGLYEKADKPGLHMLRRTWASRLLEKGVDIETVRELGGWSDLKVVQRYLASTNDLKRAAVATLEGE